MEPPFALDPQMAQTYNPHRLRFAMKLDNPQKTCICAYHPANNLDSFKYRNRDDNIFGGKIKLQPKEAPVRIDLKIVPSDLKDHDKHT